MWWTRDGAYLATSYAWTRMCQQAKKCLLSNGRTPGISPPPQDPRQRPAADRHAFNDVEQLRKLAAATVASVTQAPGGGSTYKPLNSTWGKKGSAFVRPYPRLG